MPVILKKGGGMPQQILSEEGVDEGDFNAKKKRVLGLWAAG